MNYRKWEAARANPDIRLTADMRALVRRRTMPFLDMIGIDRPLSFVLEEVYLQGMRDAAQAITERDELRDPR